MDREKIPKFSNETPNEITETPKPENSLRREVREKKEQYEVSRQAQIQEQQQGVEAVYKKYGMESPAEREKSREKAIEIIFKDAGVRVHESFPEKVGALQDNNAGYQELTMRLQDGRYVSHTISGIASQLLSKEEYSRGGRPEAVLASQGIHELIDIRRDVKPVYETITVPGKKGVFGIGKTPDTTQRRASGRFESSLHGVVVEGGKKEAAVRISYFVPPPSRQEGRLEWSDYSGRSGQMLLLELVLPETSAVEIEKIIDRDPGVMRVVTERLMKEKMLKDPNDWEKLQAHRGEGSSLRPPYEQWDAEPEGGRVYVQKEGGERGFRQECIKKITK